MKITKSPNQINSLKQKRELANVGCDICPECGQRNIGISYYKAWCECTWFFKIRHIRIDCYACRKCGCHWESDPYEY